MNYLQNILGVTELWQSQQQLQKYVRHEGDLSCERSQQVMDLLTRVSASFALMGNDLKKAGQEIEQLRHDVIHLTCELSGKKKQSVHGVVQPRKEKRALTSKRSNCTLEKSNTQYKAIVNFLTVKKHATIGEIHDAVGVFLVTKNKQGKRSAIVATLNRLQQHGFVQRIAKATYQIVEGKNV